MSTTEITRTPLDPHALGMADRMQVADAAHAALHPVQGLKPHVAVLGAAMLFAVMCERCGLAPDEMHAQARRMLRDELGFKRTNDSLQSLRDFCGIRLMGKDTTIS